jgi:hypothetical protein
METPPPISFYLPEERRPCLDIPTEVPEGYVDEISEVFFNGPWLSWTFQTYLRLRECGYPCRLVDTIPVEGIVVVHRGDLPFDTAPSPSQLFVTTLGDAGWHPYAQVQVVQNQNHLNGVENAFFMHHWTQPGLIPRNEDRGDTFENVGYFGHPDQLADALHDPEWERFLAGHGLNWIPVHKGSDRQSDYSDIDLIVAMRSFDGRSYDYKPATKLHNAWLAGVPAILGPESAYQAERTHELDYLEARTYDELCGRICALKEKPFLRKRVRQRSRGRGREISSTHKAEQWWELLTGPIRRVYEQWREQAWLQRKQYFARRWLQVKRNAMAERLSV